MRQRQLVLFLLQQVVNTKSFSKPQEERYAPYLLGPCVTKSGPLLNKIKIMLARNTKKERNGLYVVGKFFFSNHSQHWAFSVEKFNSVIADLDLQIYLPLFVMALTKRHIETFVLPLKLLMKYLKSTLVVFICKRLGCKHHLALCIERSKTFASPNTGDWTLSANNDNIKTI